jgi:hypothetical protein
MDWKPLLSHAVSDAKLNNEAAPSTQAPKPNTQDEVPALNLRVDPRSNDAFELSWNPRSPLIKDAISGTLLVNDARHLSRFIHLNAEELQSGRLMYMTASADVTFRFKVMDIVGRETVQSFRVLKDAAENGRGFGGPLNLFPRSQPSTSPIQNEIGTPGSAVSFNDSSVGSSVKPKLEEGSVPQPRQAVNTPVSPSNGGAQVTLTSLPSTRVDSPALPLHSPGPQITAAPELAPETHIEVNTVPPPKTLLSTTGKVADRLITVAAPPRVLFQYVPILPKHHSRHLDVSVPVIVKISDSGAILAATLAAPDKSIPMDLTNSALDAARQWRFSPATVNGTSVLSSMTIRFHFSSK